MGSERNLKVNYEGNEVYQGKYMKNFQELPVFQKMFLSKCGLDGK
jgi:hypothetical protein